MQTLNPLEAALRHAETEAYKMAEAQTANALDLARIYSAEYSPEIYAAVNEIAAKVADSLSILSYK